MSLNEADNQGKEGQRCSSTMDGKTDVESCKKQMYVCGRCNASFERLRLLNKHRCCNGDESSACGKDKSEGRKYGEQNNDEDALVIDLNAKLPSTEEAKAPLPKESKALQCSACPKQFMKHHSLTKHFALIHNGIMPWKCPSCSEEFLSSVKFKEHCKQHGILKPFKCGKCKSFFKSYEVLRVHDRIHTGERPFLCKICDKTFKQRSNLQDHIRKHKNDRSFICGTCGKSFNLKGDLTKHLLLHTGEKKFHCQYCPKAFPGVSNFNRHMKTHTGVKPYTCSFCQKSFPRKEKMKEHERTHTGEKPFTCATCGKSFSDSGNFSNHKKGHEDASLRKWKRFPRRSTGSLSHEAASKSETIGYTTGVESHLRPEGQCSIAPSQPVRIVFPCPSQMICIPNSQGLEPVICVVDKGNGINSTINLAESQEATVLSCQQQACVPINLNAQVNVESYSQPSSEAVSEVTMCTLEAPSSDVSTISIAKSGERIAHATDNSLMPFGLARSVEGHQFSDSFPLQENFPNVILTPTKFLPVLKPLTEDSSKEAYCADKEKGTNVDTGIKDVNSAAANEIEVCKSFDLLSSSTSGTPEKYCASSLKLIDLTRADDSQSYNYQSGCPLSPAVDSEQRKLSGILFTTPTKSYPEEKIHSSSAMICSQILVTPERGSIHVDKTDQTKVKRRALEL